MLNQQYFTKIYEKSNDGFSFVGYSLKYSPIVLFSLVDGSPLASLHFKSYDDIANTVITRRPKREGINCDFQGIINKEDMEIELIITNLNSTGYINFNVLKTDEKVSTVNPGGLNEVNELLPFESYSIRCDQSTKLSLILRSLKSDKGNTISLKEDEKKSVDTNTKPSGVYYYLSVVPQINDIELCKKFEKTKWDCVDSIVIKQTTPISTWNPFTTTSHDTITSTQPMPFYHTPPSHNTMIPPFHNGQPFPNYNLLPYHHGRPFPNYNLPPFPQHINGGAHDIYPAGFCGMNPLGQTNHYGPNGHYVPKTRSISFANSKGKINDGDIDNSKVAIMSGGRRITEQSYATNIEYNYERNSCNCVIGLSINENIEFINYNNDEEILKEVINTISRIIDGKNDDLVNQLNKIYIDEECCICMEGKPDLIFYQCGHQCCHADCAQDIQNNKCPLCRTNIKARIRVKD